MKPERAPQIVSRRRQHTLREALLRFLQQALRQALRQALQLGRLFNKDSFEEYHRREQSQLRQPLDLQLSLLPPCSCFSSVR